MKFIGIVFFVTLKILYVENRRLPLNYMSKTTILFDSTPSPVKDTYENRHESVVGLKPYEEQPFDFEEKQGNQRIKKPCAIVVLSNVQNPSMQSLLRKYRYDANGILIPSSVKYFIKLPQGLSSAPILVPLNDKAFSPLGGFVRYYKEVPPIPQSW